MVEKWSASSFCAATASKLGLIVTRGEHPEEMTSHRALLDVSKSSKWDFGSFLFLAPDEIYPDPIAGIAQSSDISDYYFIDKIGRIFTEDGEVYSNFENYLPEDYLGTEIFSRLGDAFLITGFSSVLNDEDAELYSYLPENEWKNIQANYFDLFPAMEAVNYDILTNPAYNMWFGADGASIENFYIAGWRGRILHFDGEKYQDLTYLPANTDEGEICYTAIHYANENDVWICGYDSMRATGRSLILRGNKDLGFAPVFSSYDGWAFFDITEFEGRIIVADYSKDHSGVYELEGGQLVNFLPPELSDFDGAKYVQAVDDALWLGGPKEVLRLKNGRWERFPIAIADRDFPPSPYSSSS